MSNKPLFTSPDWTFESLEAAWAVIDDIAKNKFGLDYYDSRMEIVTYEEMLNNYSSVGMPSMYNHWSFGKSFIKQHQEYVSGQSGLAYEMIINTDPAIAYLMENNTMTMQALVMAHAVCGHASFFKNNYLFQEWTQADSIVDYLVFAKQYIKDCEYKYGAQDVELTLDAAHSLQNYGIDKYKRRSGIKKSEIARRKEEWVKNLSETMKADWDIKQVKKAIEQVDDVLKGLDDNRRNLPEENILYFLEKHSPGIAEWQKEILRIVRKLAQYFYPQMQTKLMNEGWASFVHYHIMTELQEQGYITPGSYMEFLHSHSNVCCQPSYKRSMGFNPYALGFAMFRDIERICKEPTEEDRYWFPEFAGDKDWMKVCKNAMELYRDESFIQKFLSPKVIRDFKMFTVYDDEESPNYEITEVSSNEDVIEIRNRLSQTYNINYRIPHIEITDVDWDDTRTLELTHYSKNGIFLDSESAKETNEYLRYLWGYPIEWEYLDDEQENIELESAFKELIEMLKP